MNGIPMQIGVLRVLRAIAASWWRHKELRQTGQTALAQRLERETVLHDLGYLRQSATVPNAHVICGEGGTFLHLGWTTMSTLAPIEMEWLPPSLTTSPCAKVVEFNATRRGGWQPHHHRRHFGSVVLKTLLPTT